MARVPLGSHKGFSPLLALQILLFMGYLNLLIQKGFGNVFDPQAGIFGKEHPWDVLKALSCSPVGLHPTEIPSASPETDPSSLGSPA